MEFGKGNLTYLHGLNINMILKVFRLIFFILFYRVFGKSNRKQITEYIIELLSVLSTLVIGNQSIKPSYVWHNESK